MNVEKVVANLTHAALIGATAYLAAHPDAAPWLLPALQWLGQCMSPPDFIPGKPNVSA